MSLMPLFKDDAQCSLIAAGSVTGATPATAPIAGGASPILRGIASSAVTYVSAGKYTIQLPGNEPFKNCLFFAVPIGVAATDITFHVISFSAAGLITYQANAAAVATDCDHYFMVIRYS